MNGIRFASIWRLKLRSVLQLIKVSSESKIKIDKTVGVYECQRVTDYGRVHSFITWPVVQRSLLAGILGAVWRHWIADNGRPIAHDSVFDCHAGRTGGFRVNVDAWCLCSCSCRHLGVSKQKVKLWYSVIFVFNAFWWGRNVEPIDACPIVGLETNEVSSSNCT